MLRSLISLALLSSALGWLSCPVLTCQDLPVNICASLVNNNTIAINSNACDETRQCNYDRVMTWFSIEPSQRFPTYGCDAAQAISLGTSWTCPNRAASKNLVTGSYPRSCLTDSDCTLQDGTTNDCVCAPRTSGTSGFCRPHASSSYFQAYWDLCTQYSNTIEGQYEGFYWFLKLQYAVYYDTADLPECKETLWEFAQYTVANNELAGAKELLLVASLFLV